MKFRTLCFIGPAFCFILFVSATSFGKPKPPAVSSICPDVAQGETSADCPWATIGRTLHAQPMGKIDVIRTIQKKSPDLFHQIKQDSTQSSLIRIWGKSLNYDEYVRAEIVAPWIIDGLTAFTGFPSRTDRIVHAGLEHTYGYLFSILKTSFGYKRARWVAPDLEEGFGLPTGILSPHPKSGTLLHNVSIFFGHLTLLNDPASAALVKVMGEPADKALLNYPYETLSRTRLTESVTLTSDTATSPTAVITLETTIVPFPHAVTPSKNVALLIYTVKDSRIKQTQLISGFPVEQGFIDNYFDPARLGADQLVQTRFNAYVPGITNSPTLIHGTRTVTHEPGKK